MDQHLHKTNPTLYPFCKKGYRYGFNGKEDDRESGYQDYGMRQYNTRLCRFFSVDPLTAKYPELTPYQFASNTPIQAIDLDGLEAFFVHGTWSNQETFSALKNENHRTIKEIFGNKTVGDDFSWSGKNLDKSRKQAAKDLVREIKRQVKDGEPITIVGHSHGGNNAIMVANLIAKDKDFDGKEINIVTINTPAREYQLSEQAANRVNHFNIYDESDPVQIRGGNNPDEFVEGKVVGTGRKGSPKVMVETGDRKGLFMSGEHGTANRTFKGAVNIKTSESHGVSGDFHNSHNKISEWKSQLKNSYSIKKK